MAAIEASLELPDRPMEAMIESNFSSEDNVRATKDSGNTPSVPKSIKTVLPFSSTPKLESSMSDWANIRHSPSILTRGVCFLPACESKPYAWRK